MVGIIPRWSCRRKGSFWTLERVILLIILLLFLVVVTIGLNKLSGGAQFQ